MGVKLQAILTLTALASVLTASSDRGETRTPLKTEFAKPDWTPRMRENRLMFCPLAKDVDVFLVMGQSQAANMAERKTSAHMPVSYMFNKSKCHPLRDPVLGATNNEGSIWPIFSDHMGGHVVIANMAISGSSIRQWTTLSQIKNIQKTVQELETAGYKNFKVIWVQGEADDMIKMPAREYEGHLNTLARILPNRQWILTKQSHCGWQGGGHNDINVAKDRFVAVDPINRAIGPNLDELGADYRMHLDCHFNARGQYTLALRMADAVMETMILQKARWPLHRPNTTNYVSYPQP